MFYTPIIFFFACFSEAIEDFKNLGDLYLQSGDLLRAELYYQKVLSDYLMSNWKW